MSNGFSQSKPYAKHHGFWAAGLSAVSPRLGTAVGVSAVLCSEAVHAGDTQSMAEIGDENLGLRQADRWESNLYTRRGHKYDTGSCCRIRPFFCPPRVFAAGHKPELQKFKQQGGEIYAESTGRNKGNEMQSEARGKEVIPSSSPMPL